MNAKGRAAFFVLTALLLCMAGCWIVLGIGDRPVGGADAGVEDDAVSFDATADAEAADATVDADADAGCVWSRVPVSVTFFDLDSGLDGATEIRELGEAGILDSCGGNSFCPAQNTRRREGVRWAARIISGDQFTYVCAPYFTQRPIPTSHMFRRPRRSASPAGAGTRSSVPTSTRDALVLPSSRPWPRAPFPMAAFPTRRRSPTSHPRIRYISTCRRPPSWASSSHAPRRMAARTAETAGSLPSVRAPPSREGIAPSPITARAHIVSQILEIVS